MKKSLLLISFLLVWGMTFSQLSGTKTIPGDYPTIAAAITALNAAGVGGGGVTFNVAAGHTETFATPTAGLINTLTSSAGKPIIFKKSGVGANPLVTAGVGVGTTDYIFCLAGTDYVTFDGINVQENVANTTSTTRMEWGYALLKNAAVAPFDGCQYTTIKNCAISLNKANVPVTTPFSTGAVGIYAGNHIPTSTTALTITAPTDACSYSNISNNTISNVYSGIVMIGFMTSTNTLLDQNNSVGIDGGNSISNFGGLNAVAFGVRGENQHNFLATNNTVNGGTGNTGSVAGIYVYNVNTGTSTLEPTSVEISGNTVTLTSSGSTVSNFGIYYQGGITPYTTVISGNTVQNCSFTSRTTGAWYGIYNWSAAVTVTIGNNLVTGNNLTSTTGATYFMWYGSAAPTVNLSKNTISSNSVASTSTGAVYGLYTQGTGASVNVFQNAVSSNTFTCSSSAAFYCLYNSGAAPSVNLYNNTVNGNSLNNGTGAMYLLYGGSPTSLNIYDNQLFGNTKNLNGTMYCIQASAQQVAVYNNVVYSNNININSGTSGGTLYGYYNYGVPPFENLYNNQFYDLNVNGTTTSSSSYVYGMYTNTTGTAVKNIHHNTIRNLSISTTGGGTIYGIQNSLGNPARIYNNQVFNLSSSGTNGIVYGIMNGGGTLVNIMNNFISDLRTPISTGTDAIRGINISGGTTCNAYYNTVYLDAVSTSATTFGSSAIYKSTSVVSDFRNNIFINKSTPGPTGGFSVCFRHSGTSLTNLSGLTNNNNYYAGTPAANKLIYYDGTNADQTLAAYQTRVAPREGFSFTENSPFVNVATTPYDLHMQVPVWPTYVFTQCESGGSLTPNITIDYDDQPRYPNPGYPDNPSWPASAPDVGADEFAGRPLFTCQAPAPGNVLASTNQICLGTSVTLSLQNPVTGTGNAFQWMSSPDGLTYTNIAGATQPTFTDTPTAPTYYMCRVTCQNGPITVYANPVQVVFQNNIISTTPGTRCGIGTVDLQATANTGTVKWYQTFSGGAPLGTGNLFTTPVISTNTTYFAAAEVSAPANVTIGTGTSLTSSSGYPTLFGDYWYQDWSQMVYTAAELTAAGMSAGNITAITFNISGLPTATPSNWSLKIGPTAASTLSGFTTTGLTTVYGPGPAPTPVVGYNVITFTTPYYWDGVSNILIDIRGTGTYGNANATCYYTATTGNTVVYGYSSSNNPNYFTSNPTAYTSTSRLNVIFAGIGGCSSPRVPVLATVLTPPALTITGNQTVCSNEVAMITVTTPLANYDTYTWSPVTNLFTDAACTVPYVAMTNATTVYARTVSATITTYTCLATNATNQCANTAQVIITVLPPNPVIASSPGSICISGSALLYLNPVLGYGSATYQWQTSSDNINFTNITGATGSSYATPIITTTTYYKVIIKNGSGTVCTSPQYTLVVYNPMITSTTPASRCGIGTVVLQATANSGDINWYGAATGGAILATGPSFTTPTINTTTTYYVAAEIPGSTGSVIGAGASTSTGWQGPFYYWYGGEKSQYLILASELIAAGVNPGILGSLAFDVTSAGSTFNEFNLKLGSTSQTALNTTFVTGLTSVYNSPGITPTVGIFTIQFTTPYFWDGVSNLVVETCWSNNDYGNTPNAHVKYDATAFTATSYYYADAIPATTFCAQTTASSTYNSRPKMIFNATQVCSGTRVPVDATVLPPPALTLTPAQTICNSSVATISVTSTLSDYTSYTWSPVTYLFTDPACTVPYTALTSASTVYAKTTTPTTVTYECTAENLTSLCRNIAQTTVTIMPGNPAISSVPSAICVSGSAVLSITPSTGYGTATFQWQDSPDNVTFTDISGATGLTYTTPVLNSTTYYKCLIKNGAGVLCSSPTYTLMVNNPQVLGTTPATRCGTGTLTLGATGSPGSVLNWYSSPSGGTILGTGPSFTTPVISTTTDYYVAASAGGGGSAFVGKTGIESGAGTGGGLTSYLAFTAISDFTLLTVDVFPYGTGAGTVTIELRTSTGTPIMSQTVNVIGTTSTANPAQRVTLNFPVTGGADYRLGVTSWTGGVTNMYRDNANLAYPYTLPGVVSITGSDLGTSYYYFYYNWQVSTGCQSQLTPVTATVTPAPEITPSASPLSICNGQSSNLNVTSSNPNYGYTWTPGNLVGAAQTVNPTATTYYTVNALDPGTGCANSGTVSVTVLATPLPITITPSSAAILPGTIQPLAVTLPDPLILSENFNGPTNNWTTINNSTGGTPALAAWMLQPDGYIYNSYGTWHSNDNTQFFLSNSDAQGSSSTTATILKSPAFSTIGFTQVNISFYHYYYEPGGSGTGKVEASIDGTTWTTLQTYTTTQGLVDAFVNAIIPLTSPFVNQPVVYIRFKYDASWRYFWGIDNVTINGAGVPDVTWSPLTALYNDPGATIPYAGTFTTTVFAKPAATITYTATAINLTTQCSVTKDVTVSVFNPPAVTTGPVNPSYYSATGGGTVTSAGGGTILARGVCWSLNPNPTLADNFTTDGTGLGTFVSNLTPLLPNTPYHVRAYATNEATTSYGQDILFTTLNPCLPPTVLTATNITQTGADLNWTEVGAATSWDLEWGPAGFTQGSGTMVTGLTTKPYILTNLPTNSKYDFYVRSNCGQGVYTAWSGPKQFDLVPLPTILGATEVCFGADPAIYFTQAGKTNYQWTVSAGGFVVFGGGTTDDLIMILWTDAGAQTVSVNYQNSAGVPAPVPTALPVTVFQPFIAGTIAADQTICAGTLPAMLTGTAPTGGNVPYSYQWQMSTDGTAFTDIAGATDLNYQPGSLSQTTWFRMKQTSYSNCGFVYTNVVTITMYGPLVAGTITPDQAICYREDPPSMLTGTPPTGGSAPYGYQWEISTDGTLFTDIAGATGLTYQPNVLTETTYYRMKQTSSGGCGFVYTNILTITVYPSLSAGAIAADQSICFNTIPAPLTGTPPTGGNPPYSYQWAVSENGTMFIDIPGATNLNYSPGALTTTTYYIMTQTSSSGCGTVSTNMVTITVMPTFAAGSIAADQTIASGATPAPLTGVPPTGGLMPYGYQWQASANGVNFVDIPGATNLGYAPGPLTVTTWYRARHTSAGNCGSGLTNIVKITVSSLPVNLTVQNVIVSDGQTFCYDALETITVAGAGTYFTVNNGGSATFIAGQKISYLPGTKVNPGGYMHGYISNEFCPVIPPAITNAQQTASPVVEMLKFRLYPNPTSGRFTVQQVGDQLADEVMVEVYTMLGERILTERMTGVKKHEFVLPELPAGIYVVKIQAGETMETVKLIRQ